MAQKNRDLLLRRAMQAFLGAPIARSGHFHGCGREMGREMFFFLGDASEGTLRGALKAHQTGLSKPVLFDGNCMVECPECGEEPGLLYDGVQFRLEACKYPNGRPPTVVELNVPSGKLAVANDLRQWFPVIGSFNVNTGKGLQQTTEVYAKIGLLHGFVGNTCPAVYRQDARNFSIGTRGPAKSRRVAGICTDLWWYSICDYDNLVELNGGELPEDVDVVSVEPGVYRLTHDYPGSGDRRRVFASLVWARKAEPARDLQAEGRLKNLTAGQVVAGYIAKWGRPEHTKTQRIVRAIDQMLFTIGGGYDYHPNGWLASDPLLGEDSPSVAIPQLKGKYHWYPITDYSHLASMAGLGGNDRKGKFLAFNESFVRMALNATQSIIRYGVDVSSHPSDSAKSRKAQTDVQIRWAWNIHKRICAKYPQWVPAWCRDLPRPAVKNLDVLPA